MVFVKNLCWQGLWRKRSRLKCWAYSPLSKEVKSWDEIGRALSYGIVLGRTRICFQLRALPNNPITKRAPTLLSGFHSFWKPAIVERSQRNGGYIEVPNQSTGNWALVLSAFISHVLNEQGTGYEHIFSLVQTINVDWIEKWGTSSERASRN